MKKDDKIVAQIILKLEDSENIHQITMVEDRRKGNLTEVDKEKAAKEFHKALLLDTIPILK